MKFLLIPVKEGPTKERQIVLSESSVERLVEIAEYHLNKNSKWYCSEEKKAAALALHHFFSALLKEIKNDDYVTFK